MRIFFTVLFKELFVFLRSYGLLFVILFIFIGDVYMAGSGISMDARNIKVGVVDRSAGLNSAKILDRLHMPQFQPPVYFTSEKDLLQSIREKKVMVGLVFDDDFEKRFDRDKTASIGMFLDATATTQSFLAMSYLQNIVFDAGPLASHVRLQVHKLYNPNGEGSWFMALTELLAVTTMLSIILTAVIFVKEKEHGTWDIMLLMPSNPRTMILAKSLSQVIIIMSALIMSTGLVLFGHFGIPFNGSFIAFLVLSFLYTATNAGIGLFIASVSNSSMEIIQKSVVIVMPMIFLSGSWTPVFAMHPFFQAISVISPMRYYIEGTFGLFFRGTPVLELWPEFLGLSLLGLLLYTLGIRRIGRLF